MIKVITATSMNELFTIQSKLMKDGWKAYGAPSIKTKRGINLFEGSVYKKKTYIQAMKK